MGFWGLRLQGFRVSGLRLQGLIGFGRLRVSSFPRIPHDGISSLKPCRPADLKGSGAGRCWLSRGSNTITPDVARKTLTGRTIRLDCQQCFTPPRLKCPVVSTLAAKRILELNLSKSHLRLRRRGRPDAPTGQTVHPAAWLRPCPTASLT